MKRGGIFQGVEAVIDKDFNASLLAVTFRAERFVILTGVPHVSSGEFPPGSMGAKVEASLLYARATGCKALITDLDHLAKALEGREGTWIGT